MLKVRCQHYILDFKRPSGTSRGVLTTKESYFIFIEDSQHSSGERIGLNTGVIGIGECGLLRGLSYDDRSGYAEKLHEVCYQLNQFDPVNYSEIEAFSPGLSDWPSIRFGVEMALLDLKMGGQRLFYETDFTAGYPIPINGLIWMGKAEFIRDQIAAKIDDGFTCIKLKIGAINFETELEILAEIRKTFSKDMLEVRVDANGAFSVAEALEKLDRLAEYDLHSIEQPIQQNQWQEMAQLCKTTTLPIALDEELIGINDPMQKSALLDCIKPQYIVLKPSLLGGFVATQEWIDRAEQRTIGWWITSALESNIGLNAIAQFTAASHNTLPQGLGTGQLYTNNIVSPLTVKLGQLYYRQNARWDLSPLNL